MTNLKDQTATWKDGQEVTGTYLGVQYRGQIEDRGGYTSRRAPRGNAFIFVIALLEPITVFGETRNSVTIWTNGEDTIFTVAEGVSA